MPEGTGDPRTRRGMVYGAILLLAVIAGGVLGYVLIEEMSPLDALYTTVITISTVGLGVGPEFSTWGRVFTIFLIVVGVGAMLYFILNVIEFLIVEYLQEIRGRRKMNRKIEKFSDHFIVCGYGRVGESVSDELAGQGARFVVVDRDEERCKECVEKGYFALNGDATEVEVLKKAGVTAARGLVSAFPTDADNMYVTVSARELNPDIMIVVRSDRAEAESKLTRVGADRVVFTHGLLGKRMANLLLRSDVCDFLDLSLGGNRPEYDLTEVTVEPRSALVGRSIGETRLRERTGMTILAIRKSGELDFNSNPTTDTIIDSGDKLILIGTPDQLRKLDEEQLFD